MHGRIHQAPDSEALRAELVSDYLHARDEGQNQYDAAILAVSRADVAHLNALVRATLIAQGELGVSALHLHADDTADLVAGDDSPEMRIGDLVIIGRNDNRLGLYNGTRAVVTAVDTNTDTPTCQDRRLMGHGSSEATSRRGWRLASTTRRIQSRTSARSRL